MPNVWKIDQMDMKYTNIFLCKTLQSLPKRMIFGLKISHLATLDVSALLLLNSITDQSNLFDYGSF
jgi:hypothetical protein